MQEKNVLKKTIELKEYQIKELPGEWQLLCEESKKSADKAYAVYSNFRVGAAVLLEDHSIISGNNQENVAYPSGLCAERTALFYAHAQYPDKKILVIALYSPDATSLLTPCGACRQVMIEFEKIQNAPISTLLVSGNNVYIMFSAQDWLPFEFSENLNK